MLPTLSDLQFSPPTFELISLSLASAELTYLPYAQSCFRNPSPKIPNRNALSDAVSFQLSP
jgi:hypothetical protein